MEAENANVFERVTNQIVEAIEAGATDFRMPWHVTGAECWAPRNAATGRAYKGVNVVSLWASAWSRGYGSGLWATYQQWFQLEAQVRKGEKGTPVTVWLEPSKRDEERDDAASDEKHQKRYGVRARGYTVFNVAQVDGYTPPEVPKLTDSERINRADEFVSLLGADVRPDAGRACYIPAEDVIEMPPFRVFRDAAGYYSTFCHEATHWSGAPHRLARALGTRFGSEAYAMEELVAELGAAFLCAKLGISNIPRPDHAAYLTNWLGVLRQDKRAIFTAASQAQRAVDWLVEKATMPVLNSSPYDGVLGADCVP